MDGPPWPGYAAHVLEHFLALGRLNVLRFAERVEVLAAQHGQRAQLQVLQHLGLRKFLCLFLFGQKWPMEEPFEPCHGIENFRNMPTNIGKTRKNIQIFKGSIFGRFWDEGNMSAKIEKENHPNLPEECWNILTNQQLHFCSCAVHNSGNFKRQVSHKHNLLATLWLKFFGGDVVPTNPWYGERFVQSRLLEMMWSYKPQKFYPMFFNMYLPFKYMAMLGIYIWFFWGWNHLFPWVFVVVHRGYPTGRSASWARFFWAVGLAMSRSELLGGMRRLVSLGFPYMAVSANSGTPKSSILIGFSIINHPFWGTTIFGNTHIRPAIKPLISGGGCWVFVTKGQVDPPSYDSQAKRLVWVARELMCFTEPRSVFLNPRLLQNPRVIQVPFQVN